MTPAEFLAALGTLRWSLRGLADALGRPPSTIDQWKRGATRIPDDVAAWLRSAATWLERHPPPRRP